MKKTIKRSGFTIVELVIVIAVIAVLAGVLIPTFGGIIERANESNDTQVVATINKLLVVENIYTGRDPNDAVEIKKMLKDNGVSLKTKSEGKYLWYDIEENKVILAGLDADGLALENNARVATAKGKFNPDTTAPENFIVGYLFLSEEADGDLAENIYALRNPEGKNSEEIKASLLATLAKFEDGNLKDTLEAMLSTTAVMAKNGTVGFIGDNKTSVNRIIVSSEMTSLTTSTIDTIDGYVNIVAVDFHSGVVTVDNEAVTILKNRTKKPYFVYAGTTLEKVDKDNDDIPYLISKDESGEYITSVYVENVITGVKNQIAQFDKKDEVYTFSYNLNYKYLPGTADKSYDFVTYSFYRDGSNPLPFGEKTHSLNSTEKLLVDAEGNLIIYLVCTEAVSDFKVGNDYYSSKTVTHMLANLIEENGVKKLPIDGNVITVVSTTAKLDASLIGQESATLTLPSNVTLHLPYYTDNEKTIYSSNISAKDKNSVTNGSKYNALNKLDANIGHSKLVVAEGVTLENKGTIYVDAQLYYAGTNTQCYIKDVCGVIEVDGILKSEGTLYAYGIVRGKGEIIANEGLVVEVFTILDWPGGTIASDNIDRNITPFNNWLADNIRAKLTLNKGVKYSAFGIVDVSVVGPQALEFVLVDDNTDTNPLFLMEGNGTQIQKTYGDGYHLTILAGTVKDVRKEVTVASAYTIKFYEMPLPLPNFDITVKAGASLELSNCLFKVLPGSEAVVEEAKDGKNAGKLIINTEVAFFDSFDLKMIKTYKENIKVGDFTINSAVYEANLKKLTVNYKKGDGCDTESAGTNAGCAVITYIPPANYDGTTSLLVNGELVFGSKAIFTGDIESSVTGAKITIEDGAKFENKGDPITDIDGVTHYVHGFKEGVAVPFKSSIIGIDFPTPEPQPTYDPNVDLTGKFALAGSADAVTTIPTGKATYTYNGSVWGK